MTILDSTPDPIWHIANAARTCVQPRKASVATATYINNLIQRRHWTPFEFVDITFEIEGDRAVANALTRHRMASFMQESTHYIDYTKRAMSFEMPDLDMRGVDRKYAEARLSAAYAEASKAYFDLVACGVPHSVARAALPLGLRTHLLMKVNARSLRHIIELRACGMTGPDQPDMVRVAKEIARRTHEVWPWLVDDLIESGKLVL